MILVHGGGKPHSVSQRESQQIPSTSAVDSHCDVGGGNSEKDEVKKRDDWWANYVRDRITVEVSNVLSGNGERLADSLQQSLSGASTQSAFLDTIFIILSTAVKLDNREINLFQLSPSVCVLQIAWQHCGTPRNVCLEITTEGTGEQCKHHLRRYDKSTSAIFTKPHKSDYEIAILKSVSSSLSINIYSLGCTVPAKCTTAWWKSVCLMHSFTQDQQIPRKAYYLTDYGGLTSVFTHRGVNKDREMWSELCALYIEYKTEKTVNVLKEIANTLFAKGDATVKKLWSCAEIKQCSQLYIGWMPKETREQIRIPESSMSVRKDDLRSLVQPIGAFCENLNLHLDPPTLVKITGAINHPSVLALLVTKCNVWADYMMEWCKLKCHPVVGNNARNALLRLMGQLLVDEGSRNLTAFIDRFHN